MGGNETKLRDGPYASSHGIDGLMLDMPIKNPRKKKKAKIGDMVRREVGEFIYPFRGYVEHLYNHSAIIRIENTMECDKWLTKSRENLAIARLVNMEVINNEIQNL